MKKEIIAMVICILTLLVVFSSGCVEKEEKADENMINLEQRFSTQESNYTTLKNKYMDVSDMVHVVYIISIGIPIIIFLVTLLCYRRARRPFKEIASELGLEYKKGFFLSSTPIRVSGRYRKHNLQVYVGDTVGAFGRASGGGTATNVKTNHFGNINNTICLFSKGSEWFVKTKYRSGVPEFDKKFRVNGDETVIGDILNFLLIEKILVLKKVDFIKVTPKEISLARWSTLVNKDYLIKAIDIVMNLAENVERLSSKK
ncbi:MAG: hypothetical protein KJ886_00640 [Candidatus Thermoplasmatota archaeon]|nr:hypothetical protein [Candidatus Thermoplasmatota archaeon]